MVKSGDKIIVECWNFSKGEREEVRGEFTGIIFDEKQEPKLVMTANGVERKIGLDFVNFVRPDQPDADSVTITRPSATEGASVPAATAG